MSIPEDKIEIIGGLIAGMEKALTCPVCNLQFKIPTVTRCGHSFCKSCIEIKINEIGKCPTCAENLTQNKIFCTEQKRLMLSRFNNLKESFEKEYGLSISQITPIEAYDKEGDFTSHSKKSRREKQYRILRFNKDPTTDTDIPNISFEQELSTKVTHIILGEVSNTDGLHLVKPTREYFLAILFGCHIINEKWLKLCMEQGKMIPEQRFEIQGDIIHGRTGAPNKARNNREIGKHLLFKGLKVNIIGDVENEYYTYIRLGDADIDEKYDDIIVCYSLQDATTLDELKESYKGKTLISKDWIDACICNFEIVKKDRYIL
ncbi:MAG: hypothetical protein EXX96DRAFT_621171 [Benjaminiella poitrasii]|nr:MAG: hypothetical protein EXX96DRAFT_621171 [Benjaminiella poitrasii]